MATITQIFDDFVAGEAAIDLVEEQLKAMKDENAANRERVLQWFNGHKPDGGRHRGVIYTKRSQTRLDVKKARQLLGAKAREAEYTIHPERLELEPEAKAKALAERRPTLRQVRQRASA